MLSSEKSDMKRTLYLGVILLVLSGITFAFTSSPIEEVSVEYVNAAFDN